MDVTVRFESKADATRFINAVEETGEAAIDIVNENGVIIGTDRVPATINNVDELAAMIKVIKTREGSASLYDADSAEQFKTDHSAGNGCRLARTAGSSVLECDTHR